MMLPLRSKGSLGRASGNFSIHEEDVFIQNGPANKIQGASVGLPQTTLLLFISIENVPWGLTGALQATEYQSRKHFR